MNSKAVIVALTLLAGTATAPATADSDSKASGVVLYQQYCASCHGPEGEGQPNWEQPDAAGELPAPPHDASGHTWKHSDAMLYRMVAEGWRDPWNQTDRLTMPAFGSIMTSEEIRAVITYLKTLWTPEQRQFQQQESRTTLH